MGSGEFNQQHIPRNTRSKSGEKRNHQTNAVGPPNSFYFPRTVAWLYLLYSFSWVRDISRVHPPGFVYSDKTGHSGQHSSTRCGTSSYTTLYNHQPIVHHRSASPKLSLLHKTSLCQKKNGGLVLLPDIATLDIRPSVQHMWITAFYLEIPPARRELYISR